jgi:hypothetical protein
MAANAALMVIAGVHLKRMGARLGHTHIQMAARYGIAAPLLSVSN